ncbi:MAG: MFS transporter [Kofleriaceae bacterium]
MRVRPTQILVVLALTNLVSYAARNALLDVYPDLKATFGIDDAQVGALQTVFMIPHAAATLLFGWAGDHYDRRRVIAAGIALASLAGAAGALATNYAELVGSRALVGFGTAAVVPVANSILGQLFEGPHKARRMSVFNLGLFVGGIVGIATGTALGFPIVVIALALPGLALGAMLTVLAVPPPVVAPARAQARRVMADLGALIRIRSLRWVIVSTTAMAFGAGGLGAWFVDFLKRDKAMSSDQALTLFGLAGCGGLAGVIAGGRIADRLRDRSQAGRLWTIVIGMSCTVPCAAASIEVAAGPLLYISGIATMFFISWYHAPMAATVDDLAPSQLSATAQGLVIFTMHLVGTAPSAWLVGMISDRSSLHTAMWVPAAAIVVAAAAMALATSSFAEEHARARGGVAGPASL